jgi:hypothetical protein
VVPNAGGFLGGRVTPARPGEPATSATSVSPCVPRAVYRRPAVADWRKTKTPCVYRNVLEPEFGAMVADETGEVGWQMFVDRLASEGVSRSR